MLIIVIICSLYFYAKYVGVKGLVVKEYRINSEILSENFDGIKIVHFSDILYNSTFDLNDFKELVSNINKLKPDIIVYTGDLIYSKKISNSDKEKIIEYLSSLNASIGKYAIYGEKLDTGTTENVDTGISSLIYVLVPVVLVSGIYLYTKKLKRI